MKRWFVLSMALALAGCGDDGGGVREDAGRGVDASAPLDGGGGDDASAPTDGGGGDDAQTGDAGESDAGESDAGESDAGGSDAGTSDAGVPQGGDRCESALDVTAGTMLTGQSTMDATDDYSPIGAGCPSGGRASGRDVVYVVRPSAPTTYRVRVTPTSSTFDPMLYAVRGECSAEPDCTAGTVLNGAGQPEEITFTANTDETVHIVVDGETVSRGPFDLSVTIE